MRLRPAFPEQAPEHPPRPDQAPDAQAQHHQRDGACGPRIFVSQPQQADGRHILHGGDSGIADRFGTGVDHRAGTSLAASFSLPLGCSQQAAAPAPAEEEEPAPAPNIPAAYDPAGEIEAEDAIDEVDEDEGEFGSLLGMGNPFRRGAEEFVRIEDEPEAADGEIEPAVIFPSAQRAIDRPAESPNASALPEPQMDGEENERALREALLNLQRMRGAG